MYWHEGNIIYYVKDFNDKSTWKYVCTCKDEATADFIRNLLDFSENGFEDVERYLNQLEESIAEITNNDIISNNTVENLNNSYLMLKKVIVA